MSETEAVLELRVVEPSPKCASVGAGAHPGKRHHVGEWSYSGLVSDADPDV